MGKDRPLLKAARRLRKEEEGKDLLPVESFTVLENMVCSRHRCGS